MLIRKDGTPSTNASLLHVTMGDETADRIVETYYSPANLGGIGRAEFKQQVLASNPHVRFTGSTLRANQLLRIDLRRFPAAPMCRADEVRRDLERCGEIWRSLAPSQQENLRAHGSSLHLLHRLKEYGPAFGAGIFEGLHKIAHSISHEIDGVILHYKNNVMGVNQGSKAARYAVRTAKIQKIEHLSGSILSKAITSRPWNSELWVPAQLGRRAGLLFAEEGSLEGLSLFSRTLENLRNASLLTKGAYLGMIALDAKFKYDDYKLAADEFKLGVAIKGGAALTLGAGAGYLAMFVLPLYLGGVTLVLVGGALPPMVDYGAGLAAELIAKKQFGVKFAELPKELPPLETGALIGLCRF